MPAYITSWIFRGGGVFFDALIQLVFKTLLLEVSGEFLRYQIGRHAIAVWLNPRSFVLL